MFVISFPEISKSNIKRKKNLDCVINTTGSCFFFYIMNIFFVHNLVIGVAFTLETSCIIMRQPTEHVGFSLPYSNCLCILTFFVYQHENFTFSHTDTIQIFPTCSKPLAPRVYDNQHLKVNNSLMTNILVVYLECVEQFCISLNRSCYKQYRINVHIDQQMVLG